MSAPTQRKPDAPCEVGHLVLWHDDEDCAWSYGIAQQVDSDGNVETISTPDGGSVTRMVGSVLFIIRPDQLTADAVTACRALKDIGFADLTSARVALIPFLDLTRQGTREVLMDCGVYLPDEVTP